MESTNEIEKENKVNIDKKRIEYIDIARGIAIICMIIGHLGMGYNIGTKIIYSFHMPLFIIVSGMLFKEEGLKKQISKIVKRLLLPYIIAILFTHLISKIFFNNNMSILYLAKKIALAYSNYKTFFVTTQSVDVLWFIPFLAIVRIIFYAINAITRNDKVKGIIVLLITIVGTLLAKNAIYLPWSLDVALASMIFYYIGYVLKKYNYIEKILNSKKILLILIIIWYIGILWNNIELAVRDYSIIGYISAIAGTLVILKISKLIEKISKNVAKILTWYGKNSIYIICFHYFERAIIPYYRIGAYSALELFIAKFIIITFLTYVLTETKNIFLKNKKTNRRQTC